MRRYHYSLHSPSARLALYRYYLMANVRRAAIEAGTPYIVFSENVELAEAFAPLYWDKTAERCRTELPQDWEEKLFQHKPLNQSKDVIRLLTLHPGIGDDPIICGLEEVAIGEKLYTAVSYQWGDMAPEKQINILNGGIMTVRPNIYAALKQFRSPVEDKVLWVDSICIYPIRSRFSCRRFWRHAPPEMAVFISTFLSESVNLCSRSRHVECIILVSDFLTVVYKRLRGLPITLHNLNTLFLIASLPALAFFLPSWN
jgi:Heterokaryon incompatibility protein (HET)